jgi:leishmanolysin
MNGMPYAVYVCKLYFVFAQNCCSVLIHVNAAVCDEQCSLHGGVCDNGKCEFRCSDYAGYTCQKGSTILPSLSMCHDVLVRDSDGQHCAPSELSILQQLEAVVLVPNYNRLMPSGRTFLNFFNNANCAAAAKRLACWVLLSSTISVIMIFPVLFVSNILT